MKRMHGGDLVIDHDGDVRGMVAGSVTVRGGASVHISAMVGGDVIVEDGQACVTGMVAGRVIGPAAVHGMVAR